MRPVFMSMIAAMCFVAVLTLTGINTVLPIPMEVFTPVALFTAAVGYVFLFLAWMKHTFG